MFVDEVTFTVRRDVRLVQRRRTQNRARAAHAITDEFTIADTADTIGER